MQSLLLNTNDAALLCGVTVKRWRTWNSLGKIPTPLRIGKCFFWKRDELQRWIEADCPIRKHWVVNNNERSEFSVSSKPKKRKKQLANNS